MFYVLLLLFFFHCYLIGELQLKSSVVRLSLYINAVCFVLLHTENTRIFVETESYCPLALLSDDG